MIAINTLIIEKPEGWLDIWEDDPPRYECIEFMTGDGIIHLGQCEGFDKLRKCDFHEYRNGIDYDCSLHLEAEKRVLYWKPAEEMGED